MSQYEYAAVPAPRQVPKVKGVKGAEQRFAHAMTELLNAWAAEGWEFLRAETLGYEEKGGLIGRGASGSVTMLVFRRSLAVGLAEFVETAPPPEEMAREVPPEPMTPRVRPVRPEPATPAPPPPPPESADAPPRPAGLPPLTARRGASAPLRPVPGLTPDPDDRPRRG